MLKKIVELCYRLVLIYFSHFPFQFAILFLSARGLALVALLQFLVSIGMCELQMCHKMRWLHLRYNIIPLSFMFKF